MPEPITTATGLSIITGLYQIGTWLNKPIENAFSSIASHHRDLFNCYNKAFKEITGINLKKEAIEGQTTILNSLEIYFNDPEKFTANIVDIEKNLIELYGIDKVQYQQINVLFEEKIKTSKSYPILMQFVLDQTKDLKKIDNTTTEMYEHVKEIRSHLIKKENKNITLTKNKYSFEIDYLNRTVINNKDLQNHSLFYQEKYTHCLIDLILKEKRIVLLSTAGDGKTTELQYTANHFSSDDTSLYPVSKSLNTFIDKTIEKIIIEEWKDFPGWENCPANKLLLILDGFDEIEPENRHTFQRRIEDFCDNYPDVHILISSRSNFYSNPKESFSGTLKDFKVYQLSELNSNQIIEYVNKYQNQYSWEKIHQFINLNFGYNFITNPFNLINVIKFIKEKKELPKSKAVIFEYLIDTSINNDIEKFRTVFEYPPEKIKEILNRLALIMERLCRNYLKENELNKIIADKDERALLKFTSLWLINKNKFIHNNYQEYLAAKELQKRNFEEIKKNITFSPENEVVNPSWSNSISLLISLLNKKDKRLHDLFELIKEYNSNIIIKAEPDKIDKDFRNSLFINLFEKHKSEQRYFLLNYVTHWELLRFCNSKEIVYFLINEIHSDNVYVARSSAINLLSYLNNFYIYENELKDKLLSFIYADGEKAKIISSSIDIISKNKLIKKDTVKKVIQKFHKSEMDFVLTSILNLINAYKLNDEYVQIIINSIERIDDIYNDSNKSHLLDLDDAILTVIKSLHFEKSVVTILNWYVKNQNFYHQGYLSEKIIENLINISIGLYNDSETIFDNFYNFFHKISIDLSGDEFNKVLQFFIKTNTQIKLLEKVLQWKGNHFIKFQIIDISYQLMDDENFNKIFENIFTKFENKELDKEFMHYFLHHFRSRNHPKLNIIHQKLIKIDKEYFEIRVKPDFEKIRKEIQLRDFNNILNISYWKDEIKKIYDLLKLNEIKAKGLSRIYRFEYKEEVSDFAYKFLLINSRTSSISKEKALLIIERDFEWIIIRKFYVLLNNDKILELNEENVEWIKNWCNENITKIDFKASITESKTDYRRNTLACYIEFFMMKFNLIFESDKMLEMLSFITNWNIFEYVVDKLEEKNKNIETKDIIQKNVENNIKVKSILQNHIIYCNVNGLPFILPYCYSILTLDDSSDLFLDDLKQSSFNAIKALNDDDYAKLKKIIYDIIDDFKWKIVDDFIKNNIEKEFVVQFLIDVTKNGDENNSYVAAKKLITLQRSEGLEYVYIYLQKHKKWHQNYINKSPFKNLDDPSLIDCMMKLLELYLTEDITNVDKYNSYSHNIQLGLTSIAKQSDDAYQQIRDNVTDLIDKYEDKADEKISTLYYYLNNLKDEFYRNKYEKMSLDDILKSEK